MYKIFADKIKKSSSFNNINIVWSDPENEFRYGENKKYDPTITVIHDVLSHITSLIRSFAKDKIEYKNIVIDSGGAKVSLELQVSDIKRTANLERNALNRSRIIEVEISDSHFTLDFSIEYGHIYTMVREENADPEWGGTKPIM